MKTPRFWIIAAALLASSAVAASAQTNKTPRRFYFGPGQPPRGWTGITPAAFYPSGGYGYEPGAAVSVVDRGGRDSRRRGYTTGRQPFLFSVALPEGNYRVTLTLGDAAGETDTTVRAEARRLMVEAARTQPGRFVTRTFTVNVRAPQIAGGGAVRLKGREQGPPLHRDWDEKLTLEFNGARPALNALEIRPDAQAATVYLAGDSTVTDQPDEPWCAWGQLLPRFFGPSVAVANYAESGETLRAFAGEKRLEKIASRIKAGDYLFIQFGHNDMKEQGAGVGPFASYTDSLNLFVAEARRHKAIPVLVTPMHRRHFDTDGKIVNTLGDYPEAVRRVAKEQNVALIDLNVLSKTLFEALGPQGTLQAFVHYPAGTFPGQTAALKDDTHFNNYGAYELAKCVVKVIKASKLGLAKNLTTDTPPFDPAKPDPAAQWSLPVSAPRPTVKPEGS